MRILIIGSGAREHAIIKALHRSPQTPELYCCGPFINPGIKKLTHNYHLCDTANCEEIVAVAKRWEIDFAFIGPEAPLEKGLADQLWQENIPTIGPKQTLAQIETSKEFARSLMAKYKISGSPIWQKFHSLEGVEVFIKQLGENNYVIKANGLMSGKGVKVAGEHFHSFEEAIVFCQEILNKKQTFIIEEKLIGQEFSFMCFADGQQLVPMPLVQDHKRAYIGDKGPNTGGMGSYSDSNHSLPFLTPEEVREALSINEATFKALMKECGEQYIGILYGSFIATKKGVYVIEFNARFGDPEALNVLAILESDFVEVCKAMIQGNLHEKPVQFTSQATVCKYLVPQGYPDNPKRDFTVDFSNITDQTMLFFASVNQQETEIVATGARTAAFVGVAGSIFAAEEDAEKEVAKIDGPLYHRADIGTPSLIQHRIDDMSKVRNS